jgi:DNA modification methylase
MILQKNVRSPKKDRSSSKRSSDLFHYYAGFSPEFVRDILAGLNISPDAVIMDPWNGSGTTTQVANDLGFSAIGFDLNPVMVIVAKAKLLNCSKGVRQKILEDLDSVIRTASNLENEKSSSEEPLNDWLDPKSALCFRNLERAIHLLLVNNDYSPIYARYSLGHLSSLASFFYLALFKTLRSFLSIYVSSNPTWIKRSLAKEDYLHPSPAEIYKEMIKQIAKMIDTISFNGYGKINNIEIKIDRATSESLPLPNSSIDLVISSPPYCTRIDYAIATSPELALLGCSMNGDLKALRDHMIGTPTILNAMPEVRSEWGPSCRSFLNEVERHKSKASKSYYYRYHTQYYDSIYRSLLEIERTLVISGKCVIVVQDSYYKDIHNDLPKIFCEMADSLEWATVKRLDYQVKQTMAGCNKDVKKYRSKSNATESVLIFEKG